MNNITKSIRKEYLIASLSPLWRILILLPLFVAMLFGTFYDGFNLPFALIAICVGFFAVNFIYIFCKLMRIVIFPSECDLFKKYGDEDEISRIMWEISCTKEYEDKYIIISQNYICNPKKIASIVACNDVLGAHKYLHKTNFVVDSVCIDITDKYGKVYRFETYNEAKCDELLKYLVYKCKNAMFGYNAAEQKYIENNKVPLHDVRKNQSQEKMCYCTHCGHRIQILDNFCEKCGAKVC